MSERGSFDLDSSFDLDNSFDSESALECSMDSEVSLERLSKIFDSPTKPKTLEDYKAVYERIRDDLEHERIFLTAKKIHSKASYETIQKENEKLKEENEKLKEENKALETVIEQLSTKLSKDLSKVGGKTFRRGLKRKGRISKRTQSM